MQCGKYDKMEILCQRFGTFIGKKYNRFLYIHGGKRINFNFNFDEQADFDEKELKRMEIFVINKEDDDYFEIECWKKNEVNKVKNINNILSQYFTGIKFNLNKKKTNFNEKSANSLVNPINLKLNNNEKGLLINIKSKYIIEMPFSFLSEINKLKLIKYNKNFQNILNIQLINYKLLSGRYIIYESINIGKEYYFYNDSLIFEGSYKNGERNGKGKEFDSKGKIIFEGEYLKGKRWKGKGKEYDSKGTLIYAVEYLNGEINGNGKEYNYEGKLIFEGEFLKGKLNGISKEYEYNGQLVYEGNFLNGILLDFKEYDEKNRVINELKNGKGIITEYYYNNKLKSKCEYLNGERNGKAKEYYYNGKLEFEGEYLNGLRWNGKEYDEKNNIINEFKNGKGIISKYDYNNKLKSKCNYLYGERNGIGREYYYNGKLKFEGEYLNGERNGLGKEFDHNGKVIFEGKYLKGKRLNGKYKVYDRSYKLIFKSQYLNGEINGEAKEYYVDGTLKFDGIYLYGYKLLGKEFVKGILIFEGEYFFSRKYNGKGYDKNGKKIYELINGNGHFIKYYKLNEQLKFEGEFKNGEKNGRGKEYIDNGRLVFEGEYLNGKPKDDFSNEKTKFDGEIKSREKNYKEKEFHYYGKLGLDTKY